MSLNAPENEAAAHAANSVQANRVFVGNLTYEVRYTDLKDFMSAAGTVVWSEILTTGHSNRSKGCGIVEYSNPEEAQEAIRTLTDQSLMGRNVFVREDRESEAKFGGPAGGARSGGDSFAPRSSGMSSGGNALFVKNLPYSASWQDLKDLFRQAGAVTRADIKMGPSGSMGSGMVAFETAEDAAKAIETFNGYEWQGRPLEVREDRFAGSNGPGTRGGNSAGSYGGRGGYGSEHSGRRPAGDSRPMPQILVRNLPWSTQNDDLIDLFETIGQVTQAEILYEPSGRSRGMGVVEFGSTEDAGRAIDRFEGYNYGNRPLALSFNDRQHHFEPTAARPR